MYCFLSKIKKNAYNWHPRFPADPYDRIWTPDHNAYGTSLSTDLEVKELYSKRFGLPTAVMQTAVTSSGPITISWDTKPNARTYIFMHFAELIKYRGNQTRKLTITKNTKSWTDPFVPEYLSAISIFSTEAETPGSYLFSVDVTNKSTLGPIVNALEIYEARDVTASATNEQDGGSAGTLFYVIFSFFNKLIDPGSRVV